MAITHAVSGLGFGFISAVMQFNAVLTASLTDATLPAPGCTGTSFYLVSCMWAGPLMFGVRLLCVCACTGSTRVFERLYDTNIRTCSHILSPLCSAHGQPFYFAECCVDDHRPQCPGDKTVESLWRCCCVALGRVVRGMKYGMDKNIANRYDASTLRCAKSPNPSHLKAAWHS